MTTTYVKHPVTGGAAEVARLVLTDRNGTPKEVSALWKDGVCLFAKKGALVKNGNEMEDIDGNDVMAWSLPSDTPIPRHTYPWESEIIPLHDEDRWYVIVPNSVVVTMGGVDITASCYDAETHKISIPMVKGDIVVEAEATEVIQFETEMQTLPSVTFLGQKEETADEDFVDDGFTHITQIEGNTFVWNQLFDYDNNIRSVTPIPRATYLLQINGVRSVVTADANTEPFVATTSTDMCINLTHLYGANTRGFALTQARFEAFFPENYYPYSAPTIINLAITSITAASGSYSKVFNLDIKNITGKLNGEGDSVTIFPNGMDNAGMPDYIYNDEGVWKAVARNRRGVSVNLSSIEWSSWGQGYSGRYATGSAPSVWAYVGATGANLVCNKFMSRLTSNFLETDLKGYIGLSGTSAGVTQFYMSKSDVDSENLPTVEVTYPLNKTKTYVLDDAWQTILNQTFHYAKSSILTTENNTAEPTTAPLTVAVASNIRGWKVKPICVANWGGNYVDDEITAKEAAAVTDIAPTAQNAYFKGCQMTSFNEFRYFIGLTKISTSGTTTYGTFQGCDKLEEITLPNLSSFISVLYYVFYGCAKLTSIDLTPWTNTTQSSNVSINGMFANTGLVRLDLSPLVRIGTWIDVFKNCSDLEYLKTQGVTFSRLSTPPNAFVGCTKLEKIEGGITGYGYQLNFGACPLDHDSAVEIINSLGQAATNGRQLIFKTETTYNTLTAEEKAIATNKGWAVGKT